MKRSPVAMLCSLVLGTALAMMKKRAARMLNSSTLAHDGECSLACAGNALVVLVSSIIYYVDPYCWYTDSAAALLLSFVFIRHGLSTVKVARDPLFSGSCKH